ncbi:tRNA pseudouridine(38/39) synthase [Malassezia sp. CBS 17886]|nr:tRNA pseudouridine(38/39) synthase [Malassezia sp. CBS 17886]
MASAGVQQPEALLRWCAAEGVHIDRRLRVALVPEADGDDDADDWQSGGGALMVVAVEAIPADEPLAYIPVTALLSSQTCSLAETSSFFVAQREPGNERLDLALALLWEKSMGAASRFHGYLSSLPASVSLPMCWREGSECAQWLTGTEAGRCVHRAEVQSPTAATCPAARRRIGHSLPRLRAYWGAVGAAVFGASAAADCAAFRHFLHAFTVVSSRAFVVDIYHGTPAADAPTVDVRSVAPLEAGDEAINTYGELSNSELLCQYGFALDSKTGWERGTDAPLFIDALGRPSAELWELFLDAYAAEDAARGASRCGAARGRPTLGREQCARDALGRLCDARIARLRVTSHEDEALQILAGPRSPVRSVVQHAFQDWDALTHAFPLHCILARSAARTRLGTRTFTSVSRGSTMSVYERYGDWSRHKLLRRIAQLEGGGRGGAGSAEAPHGGAAQSGAEQTAQAGATPQTGAEQAALSADTESSAAQPLQGSPDAHAAARPAGPRKKAPRAFDVSAQPSRKIALRFCYDGGKYSGLAAQASQETPLPTVEETIWDALCTARLVDAGRDMDAAGWSRCGRTDAGVSAAGQVVALWVRSAAVDERAARDAEERRTRGEAVTHVDGVRWGSEELPYVATLNRLLPPSIRIQAWSPVRASFSARFDCVYRHYKYFFTLGAPHTLLRLPDSASHYPTRLDVDSMRDAAARLVGEHDFRNLCKVDASKQITNFVRRIDGATIDCVDSGWAEGRDTAAREGRGGTGDVGRAGEGTAAGGSGGLMSSDPLFVLNLRGSAFLYHQVRNIMAVLFMVGAGLESPRVVDELVNVSPGAAAADRTRMRAWLRTLDAGEARREDKLRALALEDPASDLGVVPTKPSYEMAADMPLMLWECGFRDSAVQWRADAYDGPMPRPAGARVDYTPTLRAVSQLHTRWTRAAIHAELERHFALASAAQEGGALRAHTSFADARFPHLPASHAATPTPPRAELVPLGHGAVRPTTRYKRLMQRPRDVSAHEKNEKWRVGKGQRRAVRRGDAPLQSDNLMR